MICYVYAMTQRDYPNMFIPWKYLMISPLIKTDKAIKFHSILPVFAIAEYYLVAICISYTSAMRLHALHHTWANKACVARNGKYMSMPY